MTNLPIFQQLTAQSFSLMQTAWKAAITPILQNEINQGILLSNVSLSIGNNVINHLLDRKQIGWIITDIDGGATIYRAAALNDRTLTLHSNANVTCSLWMF